MADSPSANRQACVLWLFAASVAQRTSSVSAARPDSAGAQRAPDRRDGLAPGVDVLPRPQGKAANAGRDSNADRCRAADQNCPAIHRSLPKGCTREAS